MPPSNFLKIHFNIILPSMPESTKWSLFPRPPTKPRYAPLLSTSVLHPPPIPFFSIWLPEKYKVTQKRELLKCVVAAMYSWQHCGTGTLSYRQPRH
jgi:hypothetical protein